MNNEVNNNSLNELYNNSNTQGTNTMDQNIAQPEQPAPTEPVQDVVQQEPVTPLPEQQPEPMAEQNVVEQPTDPNVNNTNPTPMPTQTNNGGGNIFVNNIRNIRNDGSLRIGMKEDAKKGPKEKLILAIALGAFSWLAIYALLAILISVLPVKGFFGLLMLIIVVALFALYTSGVISASMKMGNQGELTLKEIFKWPFQHKMLTFKMIIAESLYSFLAIAIIIVLFMLLNNGYLIIIPMIISLLIGIVIIPVIMMTVYSLLDENNPEKSVFKCMKLGFILAKDRILQFDALFISYTGWMLLQPFSLGILIPDSMYAMNNFYKMAKGEQTFEGRKGLSDSSVLLIYIASFAIVILLLIALGKNAPGIFNNNTGYSDGYDYGDYSEW